MRLSRKEADIIACIELDARKSIEQIRKETGYRDHTIRYHIHRLETRGIIKPYPLINLPAIGYTEFDVFFSTTLPSRKIKAELLRALMQEPRVVWVAEMGAQYPYAIGISVREIHEVGDFLHNLAKKFPGVFLEKSVSAHYRLTRLGRRYLSAKKSKTPALVSHRGAKIHEIDELDGKILAALAHVPHRSRRELAQKLGVPLSTLELRIKKLEDRNIISGYCYEVNCQTYGYVPYKLIVNTRGTSPELTAELLAFAQRTPACFYFLECVGRWDYEMNLEVAHPEDTVAIVQDLYETGGGRISSIEVLPRFRDLKAWLYPLLDPDSGAKIEARVN